MSLTEAQQPAMFLPFLQSPAGPAYLLVHSKRDPQQLAAAMRMKVRELDAGLPVDTQTWSQMLEVVLFPARAATMALGVLGLMGAMLSITGIFGMAAYSVSKRLRELGIRMALGAPRKQVLHSRQGGPSSCWQWICRGAGIGATRHSRTGVHRLPGYPARSVRAGRGCGSNGIARAAGNVDPGATRAFGESSDPAARRLRQRGSHIE